MGGGGERKRRKKKKDEGALTDLARRPVDTILVGVNAIDDQFATSPAIIDGILQDLDASRRLDHNVESVGIVSFDLFEHRFRILSAQGHILIGGVEVLGQIHLEALGGGDDDVTAAVLSQHLGEDEAGGTGAKHED